MVVQESLLTTVLDQPLDWSLDRLNDPAVQSRRFSSHAAPEAPRGFPLFHVAVRLM
jgi:hypothetical protein